MKYAIGWALLVLNAVWVVMFYEDLSAFELVINGIISGYIFVILADVSYKWITKYHARWKAIKNEIREMTKCESEKS